MSVKIKLSLDATEESVQGVLDELSTQGWKADRLFPQQTRPALARTFVIRSPNAKVAAVEKALKPFGKDVEYVESDVTRKPI